MWIGSRKITGGFVFLFLLACLVSGWAQDSTYGKQKVTELLLQQRIILTQSAKDIQDSRQAIAILEQELSETIKNGEQRINELKTLLAERGKVYQEQTEEFEALSKSMAQLELSLKASQSATELAVSIAVILGTTAIIEGLVIIFR